MAKQICYNNVFNAIKGDYNLVDEHGHVNRVRFRETAWGKKYLGLGTPKKRDLTTNPLSSEETLARSNFAAAVAKRQAVLASAPLRTAWLNQFKADKAAGNTNCNTLNGYIFSMAHHGQINEDNTPLTD